MDGSIQTAILIKILVLEYKGVSAFRQPFKRYRNRHTGRYSPDIKSVPESGRIFYHHCRCREVSTSVLQHLEYR